MTAICIDFWNTIVVAETGGEARQHARLEAVRQIGGKYRSDITEELVQAARKNVSAEFDKIWLGNQRTLTTEELVRGMMRFMRITPTESEIHELVRVFQESLYDGPPDLAPGLSQTLAGLSEKYPLAIISDTMFSPGRVLREYLRRKDLYEFFTGFVFSDEIGVSKPDRKAFESALVQTGARAETSWHIGDIQPTDILGANRMGMKSILYTGISDAYVRDNTATNVASHWDEIRALLT